MNLQLNQISKSYKNVKAVDKTDLKIESGEIIALLGPSGCGKTTILRIIAGLIDADEGEVMLEGQNITNWPANKRPTVTVFQDYALFPHMNVYENIAYGLKAKKSSRNDIKLKVEKMMAMVSVKELWNRKIHELSGGQQQRVALARAMIVSPKVILFDEPLSSLDAKLRMKMREEIKKILKNTKITTVYVTHDQEEALAIADRVAVMNNGKIEQIGTPDEVYNYPLTKFVADFIGEGTFIEADSISENEGNYIVSVWGEKCFAQYHGCTTNKIEGRIPLFVRPEDVLISNDEGKWEAEVILTLFLG